MKLSTLAQLINRTIELSGDIDLNCIILHPTFDYRDNIRLSTLHCHMAELTMMIDPAYDSQDGATLHIANHSLFHLLSESIYSVWDEGKEK